MSAREGFRPIPRWLSLPSGLLLATACQDLVGANFSSAHPRPERIAGDGGGAGGGSGPRESGGRSSAGAGEGTGAASVASGGTAGEGVTGGSSGGAEPPSSSGASGRSSGGAASGGAGSAGVPTEGGSSQGGSGGEGGGTCEGIQDCPSSDACVSSACVSGKCESRPTCPDPAESACIATCTVASLGGAICGVVAPDADGDQHGDATCSRGDDCNDADGDVHPGATEVCDGVDGNCDGQSDVNELGLGGQNLLVRLLGGDWSLLDTAMVWSPRARSFAVVWQQTTSVGPVPEQVSMNFLGLDGTWRFADDLVVDDGLEGAGAPAVAAYKDYLGVTWIDSQAAAPGVYFRRFQAASGAGEEPVLLSGPGTNPLLGGIDPLGSHRPQVVARADDDWLVFWIAEVSPGADQIYYARRDSKGVVAGPSPIGEPGGQREHLRATIVGDSIAVVWSNRPAASQFSVVQWALLGPSLYSRLADAQENLSNTPNNSVSATHPVVSGSEAGVDIAFRFRDPVGGQPVESLHVVRRRISDGGYQCDRELDGEFYPTGSSSNGEGRVLVGYRMTPTGARDLFLASYDTSCRATAEPTLIQEEWLESGHHAGPLLQEFNGPSGSGFGLVWSRNNGEGGSISSRFLGQTLCN